MEKRKKFSILIFIGLIVIFLLFMIWILRSGWQSRSYVDKLKKDKFVPNTAYETKLPWREVIKCLDSEINNRAFKHHMACPLCNKKSEDLAWLLFSCDEKEETDAIENFGPLSICPKCRIQVEFIRLELE